MAHGPHLSAFLKWTRAANDIQEGLTAAHTYDIIYKNINLIYEILIMPQAPAIDAAFEIMDVVTRTLEGAAFGDIVDALPQSRASVARFLKSMVENGYLEKHQNRYRPGTRFIRLAGRIDLSAHLISIADPVLEQARDVLENTVILFGWSGRKITSLNKYLHPSSIVMQPVGSASHEIADAPWGWVLLEHLGWAMLRRRRLANQSF